MLVPLNYGQVLLLFFQVASNIAYISIHMRGMAKDGKVILGSSETETRSSVRIINVRTRQIVAISLNRVQLLGVEIKKAT